MLAACQDKTTVFTKLSVTESGIDFENHIPESDSLNVFTFEYIYNGGGVGIGDFNNDGLADIFFAGNKVSSKLYLNRGKLHFEDITVTSKVNTSYWCTGVAVVDINADGWKDIYVSTAFPDPRQPAPNLLFLNKGLNKEGVPVFKESATEMGLADSSYGTQAAFLDYDRDGDLDVYLCINSGKESDRNQLRRLSADGKGLSQDKLLRNEGISSSTGLPLFKNVSKEAGIMSEGWGLGVIVKDINRDGWPDIYVANDFQSNDHLYINNKNGTFTNRVADYLSHQCHNAMGVDMADCNNDGLEDICVVDMLPDDNLRQKMMFGAVPNEKYASALRMGYQPQFVRNVLQLNNGLLPDSSGTVSFSDIGYLAGIAATDWSWSPLWADFNLDGWRDLLITNGYVKDITDMDFTSFANEYKMFGTQESRTKEIRKKAREIGEVKKRNWLFVNNHDLSFTDKAEEWGLADKTFSNGAAYADLDNDGDLDIVLNNLNDKSFIYRNNTISVSQEGDKKRNHFITLQLKGDSGNADGLGTKITVYHGKQMQYAEQCLQRGYLSSVDARIHFGLGADEKMDSLIVQWPSGYVQKMVTVEADQLLVMEEKNAGWDNPSNTFPKQTFLSDVTRLFQLDYMQEENDYLDFLYQYTLPHKYSSQGPGMAVADINGDGYDDLYVGGASRHSGFFFIQTKSGFIKKQFLNEPEKKLQEETGVLLFDADNDGDNDLYCVAGGNEFGDSLSYQDMFFVNDGRGNFSNSSQSIPNTTASGSCVIAADYDHDGDLDLFVGGRNKPHQYPLTGRSYLLRNDTDLKSGKILFTDITEQVCAKLAEPGMVTSAIWTDVNNDDYPDLLLAGEFMPLQFYINRKAKSFEPWQPDSFKNSNGWYNSLLAVDYDNDGDMDYVAGNLGLNSRFKASTSEPVTVRYNDYNRDGALDAFLFCYTQGKEYPYHTRNTIVDQIPSLKKRIYYYRDYGASVYHNLFNEEERKNAGELKAFEMASLLIENTGNNNFSVSRLPMMAQTAPLFGMLNCDLNKDGIPDIIAVGNSFAPEALTGRYDASIGWVLMGSGEKKFSYAPVQQSGFFAGGDAKSFVKLNWQNKGELLIAGINGGSLRAYMAANTSKCLSIDKDIIYAIITRKNGRKYKEEFYYGSSYLSQPGRFIQIDSTIKSVQLVSFRETIEYSF